MELAIHNKTLTIHNKTINKNNIAAAIRILIDNGIEADEAETVLQALGYALIDAELEPLFE